MFSRSRSSSSSAESYASFHSSDSLRSRSRSRDGSQSPRLSDDDGEQEQEEVAPAPPTRAELGGYAALLTSLRARDENALGPRLAGAPGWRTSNVFTILSDDSDDEPDNSYAIAAENTLWTQARPQPQPQNQLQAQVQPRDEAQTPTPATEDPSRDVAQTATGEPGSISQTAPLPTTTTTTAAQNQPAISGLANRTASGSRSDATTRWPLHPSQLPWIGDGELGFAEQIKACAEGLIRRRGLILPKADSPAPVEREGTGEQGHEGGNGSDDGEHGEDGEGEQDQNTQPNPDETNETIQTTAGPQTFSQAEQYEKEGLIPTISPDLAAGIAERVATALDRTLASVAGVRPMANRAERAALACMGWEAVVATASMTAPRRAVETANTRLHAIFDLPDRATPPLSSPHLPSSPVLPNPSPTHRPQDPPPPRPHRQDLVRPHVIRARLDRAEPSLERLSAQEIVDELYAPVKLPRRKRARDGVWDVKMAEERAAKRAKRNAEREALIEAGDAKALRNLHRRKMSARRREGVPPAGVTS